MPLNQPPQKRYFTISEVAKMLELKPSTLRFWEKEFTQIQPKTNARGKRAYKQEDIDLLRRIHDLVKVQGLTLEGAQGIEVAQRLVERARQGCGASRRTRQAILCFARRRPFRQNARRRWKASSSDSSKLLEARAAVRS